MNITDLTNILLSEDETSTSQKSFLEAYDAFISFLSNLGGFAVYFDNTHDGNTANTAYLTQRLSQEASIQRENICIIYHKDCENKIKEHLSNFDSYEKSTDVSGYNGKEFILNGESEQDDEFWSKLGVNVKYVMNVRPYLDDADFSFIKIKDDDKNFITYFTDTISMNQPFYLRNYYVDLDKAKENPNKVYWEDKSNWNKAALDKVNNILQSNVSLFTVSGLEVGKRGDNSVLILALAMLEKWKKDKKTTALVFTDYSSCDNQAFALLKCFCKKKDSAQLLTALKELYPHADESDLKNGLYNPLVKKRAELGEMLSKIAFWDGKSELSTSKINICPTGELPHDYIAQLYTKSDYIFFESCDLLNLAVSVGVPFLYKSIDTSSAYPNFFNPSAAVRLEKISDIFKCDISAYLYGYNKNLSTEIDKIAAFLFSPEQEYFKCLSEYAQKKINDKLAASCGVFDMLYSELCVDLKNTDEITATPDGFKKLYEHLKASCDDYTKFNLSKAFKVLDVSAKQKNRLLSYLNSLSDPFIVELDSCDDIALDYYESDEDTQNIDDDNICGVTIRNVKSQALKGGVFEINFTDWYGGGTFGIYINGNFPQTNYLFNIPWLEFSDVNFSVITAMNDMPTKGSVGATFGKSSEFHGANFVIDLNVQNGLTRIMATFREPLTAFSAFGAIAGGLDFNAILPSQLNFLNLGLTELEFFYDKNSNSITCMNFAFSTNEKWDLWKKDGKALLSAVPSIGITVNSPADLSNRQIMISVGAFVDIGGEDAIIKYEDGIGKLWLSASYPPLVAQMRMASESIDVHRLIGLFGSDFKATENLKITELSILADFGNKNYMLSAAISSSWKICDNFEITGLGLHIADNAGKFKIGFAGTMKIFENIDVGVAIGYNAGQLSLQAKAALNNEKPITMNDLVDTYIGVKSNLMSLGSDAPPPLAGLEFNLIKDNKSENSSVNFTVSAYVKEWEIPSLGIKKVSAEASVGRQNDKFFAHLRASIDLLGADFVLILDYTNQTPAFKLEWGRFHGEINNDSVNLELVDLSVGEMIETLIGWCCGSRFSLDPPWNILNSMICTINLSYEFTKKKFTMSVGTGFDLGFGKLEKIEVVYDPEATEKVKVNLNVKFPWETAQKDLSWDAAKPGTAPDPNSKGNKYFDLNYLAFGQKVEFFAPEFNPLTTKEAMDKLLLRSKPDDFPAFNSNIGMLVASNFKVLKDSNNKYFLDASLIFYDPSLFALRITLDSTAAKVFAGFSFEIIYAKLSDVLGVFKSRITLPERFRKFDIGAFSVTMPDFYLEVYTNGDFLIDIGFPKNGDFSRSFSLFAVISGIPVTGALGLYFGKLSSASIKSAGKHLPEATNLGQFNPAIVFGLGLRIGIGKSINYGILSGGFSLTLNTILEGVIAKWNPYIPPAKEEEQWYYYLKGTVALIGRLYGKIDFGIIYAAVNVGISVAVDFNYESYRPTLLIVAAKVEADVSLTINMWLFKIKISFSFSLKIKESFKIGKHENAPWDEVKFIADNSLLLPIYNVAVMNFSNLKSCEKTTALEANLSLAMTGAGDEYLSGEKFVVGNVILTLKRDSFDKLAESIIYWILAAAGNKSVTKDELSCEILSEKLLIEIEKYFECSEIPISHIVAEEFLQSFFVIEIHTNDEMSKNDSPIESTYFPIPPSTILTCGNYKYALSEYNKLSCDAPRQFKEIFKKLMVVIEGENVEKLNVANAEITLAQWLFGDWFAIAGKYAISSMKEQLQNCAPNATIGEIVNKVNLNHLAGIVSRFFLHGLRLPTVHENNQLITPLKQGMWVNDKLTLPKEAGIFALTGQSFIVPKGATSQTFKIKVESRAKYFSVPDNYYLNTYSDNYDNLKQRAEEIAAKSKNFVIQHTFDEFFTEYVPETISFGKHFEINSKYFWTLPESLMYYFNQDCLEYPKFQLEFVNCTENIRNNATFFEPVALMEFNVEFTGTKGAYVICSASKRSISLLTKIITADMEIKALEVLLNTPEALSGSNDIEPFLGISQINMSTQTNPPDELNIKAGSKDMLKLLWKSFVTNNRGYILTYHDSLGTKLNDKITIAITLQPSVEQKTESYWHLINAVSSCDKPADNTVLTAFAQPFDIVVSSKLKLTPAQLAKKCYTDIRRIAEKNNLEFGALWSNRNNKDYFTKDINVTVQPGFRVPSGNENTKALLNNTYIIRRKCEKEDELLNYPLICYGKADSCETSAPISHTKNGNDWIYNITLPVCEGYDSYGKDISTRFDWVDYYGNKLSPQFNASNKAGYQDQLLGLSKWAFMSVSWYFKSMNIVSLKFDYNCEDDYSTAQSIEFYERLLMQLEDKNLYISLKCSFFSDTAILDKIALTSYIHEIIQSPMEDNSYTLDFTFDTVVNSNLFALECFFIMERRNCFAGYGYEEVSDILITESSVSFTEQRDFITKFDFAFSKQYTALKSSGSTELYAFKLNNELITCDKNKKLSFFLPRPISNRLHGMDNVDIIIYESEGWTENRVKQNYRDVDLNIWLRNALRFADKIMSAEIASASAIADGDHNALLQVKRKIAEKLSQLLANANDNLQNPPEEAFELFRQRLLGTLSYYYGVKAIGVLPVTVKGIDEGAKLYGNLTDLNNNAMNYSTPKLEKGNQNLVFAVTGTDVTLDSKGAVISSADLKLCYTVTHIESNITEILDNFNASDWYGKTTIDIASLNLGESSLPLPLYNFPETPVMVSQEAETYEDEWNYEFTYSRSYSYPQQKCYCRVKYNSQKYETGNDVNSLFRALAQINESKDLIDTGLCEIAAKINEAGIKTSDSQKELFRKIYKCAITILNELENSSFDVVNTIKTNSTYEEVIEFKVNESNYDDKFSMNIERGIIPVLENCEAKLIDAEKEASIWIFKKHNSEDYLSYLEGQTLEKRKFILPKKKILQYQDAVAQMYVIQNEDLNSDFVFTTPTVEFDTSISASCTITDENLGNGTTDELYIALKKYLNDLSKGNDVEFQATCYYSNEIINGITPVKYPVFIQPKIATGEAGFDRIVDTWKYAIKEFADKFQVNTFAKGKFCFDFVFISQNRNVPLLTVKNAYFKLIVPPNNA